MKRIAKKKYGLSINDLLSFTNEKLWRLKVTKFWPGEENYNQRK